MVRPFRLVLVALGFLAAPLAAQRGTLVMAFGFEPTVPVPVIGVRTSAEGDVADQLFLRLAGLRADNRTAGDNAMLPELAASWRRRDATTIDFSLDPRARWHDGVPVTARDVAFTWRLVKEPALAVTQATFEPIADVVALDARTVRVTFRRPFAEQVYLAGYNLQPLPEHLLRSIPPAQLAGSDFVRAPIGNGPFRFERRVPGQFLELRADPTHFRGRPGLQRVVVRTVQDPAARANLFLAGETDLFADPASPAYAEIAQRPTLRIVNVSSSTVAFVLFNTRNPADTATAHPVLSDLRVREALTLALDRRAIATVGYGATAGVPEVAQSQLWAWATGGLSASAPNPGRARALLEQAGWVDRDGDGIRERNGRPLRLRMIFPSSSGVRTTMAIPIERMLRDVGVALEIERFDRSVYLEERAKGTWDLEFAGTNQDPTPSSLVQSWSCASAAQPGSSNVARFCDPTFDRLLRATETARDPVAAYRAAFARLAAIRAAIGIVAPINQVGVHARFANVTIRPASPWSDLWRWTVRPGQLLPRDR
jgi:peptide/nickel transport system substrate-binding protein